MAKSYKPLSADRVEDMTLGAFGNLPPSKTLNHLIRYLSTWSGSEYDLLLPLPNAVLKSTSMTANCSWYGGQSVV
jgi:hypothetical protein